MNVCFVANFYKTYVFDAIAKQLYRNGIDIYWIVLKESQYAFLKLRYPVENILLIDRKYIKKPDSVIADFKLNELVFGDRVWKYEKENGVKYLTNIQSPVYRFLNGHQISFIFGEVTWAHELLIHRICSRFADLKCNYYSIGGVRVPNGRICFFKDEKQAVLLEIPHPQKGTGHRNAFKLEKPDYLNINDKIVRKNLSFMGKLKRLKHLLTNENIEKNDPNVSHGFHRFFIPVREELHRLSYQWVKRVSPEVLKDKKYIFFGFHKQPEASIDVCGRYYEDQLENVINIWRQLPPDWYLVIKEHSNAIGDRGYQFFKKIMKYPRIIIVNEKSDSYKLIQSCELVITNTGTMALEAALMGIPAITLSPVFFNKLNYCRHCTWTDLEKYDSIEILIEEIKTSPDNKEEYQGFILDNSLEGVMSDIRSLPTVTKEDNLKNLVAAFLTVIG